MANERAKALRKNATPAERALWRHLRDKRLDGHRFRRQHPRGPYIVDFVCLEQRLIVELDGGQHAEDRKAEYDRRRDAWIEAQGFRIIRFWNDEVYRACENVLALIGTALRDPRY